MKIEIPGHGLLEIKDVILDFNGTIAIDGKLIEGVKDHINRLAAEVNFHVITADTYGTVQQELSGVNCTLINLSHTDQFKDKLDYLHHLGKSTTLCAGNGKNDQILLKESALGIALIQDEGVCVSTLMAADIACKSIMDVFSYFDKPNRLKATLRN